jgi:hypothetical protein
MAAAHGSNSAQSRKSPGAAEHVLGPTSVPSRPPEEPLFDHPQGGGDVGALQPP